MTVTASWLVITVTVTVTGYMAVIRLERGRADDLVERKKRPWEHA